tara:strand:- start:342 stop:530 length:189 start_codon:yes stop_codon:yes gene_type:complete
MGGYKDIQTEAEEKAADPVFRLAVILIMEDVLQKLMAQITEQFAKAFAFRSDLRNFVWRNKK